MRPEWASGPTQTIVTTPHIRASLFHDPERAEGRISEVEAAYRRLAVAVAERFPDVRLGRGFEVMLDIPDPDLIYLDGNSLGRPTLAGVEHIEIGAVELAFGEQNPIKGMAIDAVLAGKEAPIASASQPGYPARCRDVGSRREIDRNRIDRLRHPIVEHDGYDIGGDLGKP